VPIELYDNDKLIELIKVEISKQSWPKLVQHMKMQRNSYSYIQSVLPQKDLEAIGQLSADNVLSKFPTCHEIETEFDRMCQEKLTEPEVRHNCCTGRRNLVT
jgi:hypothetical protein